VFRINTSGKLFAEFPKAVSGFGVDGVGQNPLVILQVVTSATVVAAPNPE
jgi:hypothetical protein